MIHHIKDTRRRFFLLAGLLAAMAMLSAFLYAMRAQAAPEADPAPQVVHSDSEVGQQPGQGTGLYIENKGQFDPAVRFVLRHGLGQTWLAEDAIWLTVLPRQANLPDELSSGDLRDPADEKVQGTMLKLTFAGANPSPVIEPEGKQQGHFSYLKGSDPAAWVRQAPLWRAVRYRDLYPGIDLVFSGSPGGTGQVLPWRLEAETRADLNAVRLLLTGSKAIELDGSQVWVQTNVGEFRLPLIASGTAGRDGAVEVPSRIEPAIERLDGDEFLVRAPLASPTDVASPADTAAGGLLYSTYLGGSSWDWPYDVVVDGTGSAYVAGVTQSADFTTTIGAFSTTLNVQDAFVVKLGPDGSALEYGTFLGGSGEDTAYGLEVVGGQAYVAGYTWSADFPTTAGAFDTSCGDDGQCDGWNDAFLAHLSADGSDLLYATYVGGKDTDRAYAVDVSAGTVYLAGTTRSDNFPTTRGAFDRSCGSDDRCDPYQGEPATDAFLVRLNPAGDGGSDLLYGTYLGGAEDDSANDLVVSGGDAFLTGYSNSFDFPAAGYVANNDAFVVRLEPSGQGADDLMYGVFLGGGNADRGEGIAVSGSVAAIVGETRSADFPVITGTYNGGFNDAFVAQIDIDGSVTYASFLGGSGRDHGRDVVIDDTGAIVLAGYTESLSDTFPITAGAYDQTHNGERDVFVARLILGSSLPQYLAYASYLGGSGDEDAYAVEVNEQGQGFLVGYTTSITDFPVTDGSFSTSFNGGSLDAFVSNLQVGVPPGLRLKKSVNGYDSDEAPGQYYYVGQPVTWTYVVTNTGLFELTDVSIKDDQLGHVCGPVTLAPDEALSCEMHGLTEAGQYVNAATATGQPPPGFDAVGDVDLSHYFGAVPDISLSKRTNGISADVAPGPYIRQGELITWSYHVTNTGNVLLTGITVTDSHEGPAICGSGTLAPNASMTCLITGTATTGQYANEGSVSATPPAPLLPVGDQNSSHYFGVAGSLAITKLTNGQQADEPPGPYILVGDPVTWTYVITNASNIPFTQIAVADNQVGAISCPQAALDPGLAMVCQASGKAAAGQYRNDATVSGQPPEGPIEFAEAVSHYHGADPSMELSKQSSGVLLDGHGPYVRVNDPVTWTYVVTNTGNVTLTGVTIWDDNGTVDETADDFQVCDVGSLAPGAQSEPCTASELAVAGRYRNLGLVYGTPPGGLSEITAEDASTYFGAAPAIALQKFTNGELAVAPPGPGIIAGQTVIWSYRITNTGNITLTTIVVSDDNGTPEESDDVAVCQVSDLGPGHTAQCQFSGTATLGQYANVGQVVGTPLIGESVSASASSYYLGLRGVFLSLIVR